MKMKKYLCIKLVESEPMTRGNYNIFKGWTIPEDENPDDEGYKIKYHDGYVTWSPKHQFESTYIPLGDSEGAKIV